MRACAGAWDDSRHSTTSADSRAVRSAGCGSLRRRVVPQGRPIASKRLSRSPWSSAARSARRPGLHLRPGDGSRSPWSSAAPLGRVQVDQPVDPRQGHRRGVEVAPAAGRSSRAASTSDVPQPRRGRVRLRCAGRRRSAAFRRVCGENCPVQERDWSVPVRRCRGCLEEGTSGSRGVAAKVSCRITDCGTGTGGMRRSCRKTVFQSGAWQSPGQRAPTRAPTHLSTQTPTPGPGRFPDSAGVTGPQAVAAFRRAHLEDLLLQLPADGARVLARLPQPDAKMRVTHWFSVSPPMWTGRGKRTIKSDECWRNFSHAEDMILSRHDLLTHGTVRWVSH